MQGMVLQMTRGDLMMLRTKRIVRSQQIRSIQYIFLEKKRAVTFLTAGVPQHGHEQKKKIQPSNNRV
jgi:hypothetical protein